MSMCGLLHDNITLHYLPQYLHFYNKFKILIILLSKSLSKTLTDEAYSYFDYTVISLMIFPFHIIKQ